MILKKQQGATLFTSLMIVLAVTILAISAARVSTIDVMVSSNEQQRMMLYQKAESILSAFVSTNHLDQWSDNGYNVTDEQVEPYTEGKYKIDAEINQLNNRYHCLNPDGSASQLGLNKECCQIYDFRVTVSRPGSSAIETHYRGAGKEKGCE